MREFWLASAQPLATSWTTSFGNYGAFIPGSSLGTNKCRTKSVTVKYVWINVKNGEYSCYMVKGSLEPIEIMTNNDIQNNIKPYFWTDDHSVLHISIWIYIIYLYMCIFFWGTGRDGMFMEILTFTKKKLTHTYTTNHLKHTPSNLVFFFWGGRGG